MRGGTGHRLVRCATTNRAVQWGVYLVRGCLSPPSMYLAACRDASLLSLCAATEVARTGERGEANGWAWHTHLSLSAARPALVGFYRRIQVPYSHRSHESPVWGTGGGQDVILTVREQSDRPSATTSQARPSFCAMRVFGDRPASVRSACFVDEDHSLRGWGVGG